jgi:hypothetical protein
VWIGARSTHLLKVLVLVDVEAPRAAAGVQEPEGRRLGQAAQAVLGWMGETGARGG